MPKPVSHHGWRWRKFSKSRCSKTASTLILNLFLIVKTLNLAHWKFTFLPFRCNDSCLISHFNDAALDKTKFQNYRRMVDVALWTKQSKLVPSTSMIRKKHWRRIWISWETQNFVIRAFFYMAITKQVAYFKRL